MLIKKIFGRKANQKNTKPVPAKKVFVNYFSRESLCEKVLSDIKRIASDCKSLSQFAEKIVDVLSEQFQLYFVGLFLLDSTQEWLDFRAGSGEPGRILRERGHRISTTSNAKVSQAIQHSEVILDLSLPDGYLVAQLPRGLEKSPISPLAFIENLPKRFVSPILPSRSEMIMPLRTLQRNVGVLDLHSSRDVEFSQLFISWFLPVADEIARHCAEFMARDH
jgi:GAF domain-containing protein